MSNEERNPAFLKPAVMCSKNADNKRSKNFSLDMGNTNIPIQYRLGYMQMSEKEREKFLDAYWQDFQNGLEYTKLWR